MLKRIALMVLVALLPVAAHAAETAGKMSSHKIVFQVDQNDPATMNLVMNNIANVVKYYDGKGEDVQVEVVAYGPGLAMFLADAKKNPVFKRANSFTTNFPNVSFSACGNTLAAMTKKAGGKQPALLTSAKVVPAGVVELTMRQEEGWTYIRP